MQLVFKIYIRRTAARTVMLKTDSQPCEDANHLRHLEAVTDKGRNRHDEGVVIGSVMSGLGRELQGLYPVRCLAVNGF